MRKQFAPDPTLWQQCLSCWLLSSVAIVPLALIFMGWVYALEHIGLAVVAYVLMIKTTPARHWARTRVRGSLTITNAFFRTNETLDDDDFVNSIRAHFRTIDTTKRPQKIRKLDRWLSTAFLPYAQTLPEVTWGECALDVEDSEIWLNANGTMTQKRMEVVLRFTLYFASPAGAVAFMLCHGDCGTVEFETEPTKTKRRWRKANLVDENHIPA